MPQTIFLGVPPGENEVQPAKQHIDARHEGRSFYRLNSVEFHQCFLWCTIREHIEQSYSRDRKTAVLL